MDELWYVSSDFVIAKNSIDINVPVNVIKAFIKAEISADDGSANSSDSDFRCQCACAPVQWSHLGPFPLWCESVVFLWFLCFSGFSDCRIGVVVPFTWTVKEQYVWMCFDAFVVCLCSLSVSPKCLCSFFQGLSLTFDFQCLFLLLLSSSCFNVLPATFTSVLDSCALSAVCTLYVMWMQFYLKTGL